MYRKISNHNQTWDREEGLKRKAEGQNPSAFCVRVAPPGKTPSLVPEQKGSQTGACAFDELSKTQKSQCETPEILSLLSPSLHSACDIGTQAVTNQYSLSLLIPPGNE